MGQGSCQGALLHQASLDYEWCAPDLRDMANKEAGHYGASYGAQPWQEWIVDRSYRKGGYFREVWGSRGVSDSAPTAGSISARETEGTEMYDAVDEVLALMPSFLRTLVLLRHTPGRSHSETMRRQFGDNARIVSLSLSAATAFGYAKAEAKRGHGDVVETNVYDWLEGLALRAHESKSRKGEQSILDAASADTTMELGNGYAAYEEARDRLPARTYPWQKKARKAQRARRL